MRLNQVPKGYHGTTLEGNACRFLLSHSDSLLDPEVLGDVSPDEVQPYICAIKCFDKIVSASFGTKLVDISNLEVLLAEFKAAYLVLPLSVTLKVHGVLSHLIPTLRLPYFQGRGLGVCTEQAGESFHSHFGEHFWKKRKLSSMSHPSYGQNLLKAVDESASKAI